MGATTRSTPNDSSVYNRGTKKFEAVVAMNFGTDDLVTTGDIIPIMELPDEAIITSIRHMNTDMDSNGTPALVGDIGIYKATKGLSLDELDMDDDVAALDADIYVDGMAGLQAAVVTPTEVLGAGTNAVSADDAYKTVRELGGIEVGKNPFKYFLGFKATVDAATAVAGDVTFFVSWVQG